ncbi:alpha/beta fold hydrolase [Streptomyces sp. SP18BB07]|uniref:alpha/beta fold hydrolase n=1 Tax=Streptomyces sp. SP18BB07 TaxID=3002522 RepID=UPI002E79D92B|nr:alpha/beta fold hydrolase [Streptomyces sp. SP18BB07]MEE1764849.1 alpha/beta fold hydrolase [Streptomyces sp. SP18BB07]
MDPLILFVHGANHDGWCWSPVLERLDRAGVAGRSVDLPLTSFEDDTATVREAVREAARVRPVVLVAHSYGGLPVSAGGHGADRFVFVAARMPLPGQSPSAHTPHWGHPEFRAAWNTDADGAVVLRAEAREVLYADSPPNMADLASMRWRPMWSHVPEEPVAEPAWMSAPCTYVVCLKDRTVRVEAQRECAAHATGSVEIDCDHSPFFSAPDRLTALLAKQAACAARTTRT